MTDKTPFHNHSENKQDEVKASVDPAAVDIPYDNMPTPHGQRKRKTWCSYMEKGFRETRDMVDKQAESDQ